MPPLTIDLLALLLAGLYVALQGWFFYHWAKVPTPAMQPALRRWSVIIAARNEAAALARAEWNSLLGGLHPNWQSFGRSGDFVADAPAWYEVIVVDDHSTDGTAEAAASHDYVHVLRLPEGQTGKKAALARGIAHARGDWIATLDADVWLRQDWLRTLDLCTAGYVAVTGPVRLSDDGRWFQSWQALDFAGMMLITAATTRAGHFVMGNGANLAFAKTAYDAVNGYELPTEQQAASGDDMVLLDKLNRAYPGQIGFAKSPYCIVDTPAQPTLDAFIQQRWRWSAKTGLNHQPALTFTLALTWLFHVGLVIGPLLIWAGWLRAEAYWIAWWLKLVVDGLLLLEASSSFGVGWKYWYTYPLQSVAHAVYVAGVGTLALLPIDYKWKGRRWRA